MNNSEGAEKTLGTAYRDIRLVPSSALLCENKLEHKIARLRPEKTSQSVDTMYTDSSATKLTSISEEMEKRIPIRRGCCLDKSPSIKDYVLNEMHLSA